MIRNKDFATLYAGRAVFTKESGLENVSSKLWEEKVWKH